MILNLIDEGFIISDKANPLSVSERINSIAKCTDNELYICVKNLIKFCWSDLEICTPPPSPLWPHPTEDHDFDNLESALSEDAFTKIANVCFEDFYLNIS